MRGKVFFNDFSHGLLRITPPMRGKVRRLHRVLAALGITPAYAGKSPHISQCVACIGDHPRLCGEKKSIVTILLTIVGSPPPMRGKDSTDNCRFRKAGITPAYAGKSHKNENGDTEFKDHPRLCGEKQRGDITGMSFMGSPPPMRGKVV